MTVQKPVLTICGPQSVHVQPMEPGEPAQEAVLPVVGIDDDGPVVHVAFETRHHVLLPSTESLPAEDVAGAVRLAEARGGQARCEFRVHRLLDRETAQFEARSASSVPAFRFSLDLLPDGSTHPPLNVALNFLLHRAPRHRIAQLDHDYEAPEIWGLPGGPCRVLLPEGLTWTDERIHVLPSHVVDGTTYAYRVGRRLNAQGIGINIRPDEDARTMAAELGAASLHLVHYTYRLTGEVVTTAAGTAAVAEQAAVIRFPGDFQGRSTLRFPPLLVVAHSQDRLDQLADLDLSEVEFTFPAQAVEHAGATLEPLRTFPAASASTPQGRHAALDVLPADAGPKRRRWGRAR